MYKRKIFNILLGRLQEPRRFMQVLLGPRQTGKTTVARQVLTEVSGRGHYASADEPGLKDPAWIEQHWNVVRTLPIEAQGALPQRLLVLDEIQKIADWSEVVKRLWDEDTANGRAIQVLLLGSSSLLIQQGLTESLAGRFELLRSMHWSFSEMRDAFGWGLDSYVFHGGYPGSASLVNDAERWARYIRDSLVEPSISRDILMMARVDKPALLRRLFELGCIYSGQVLSYNKMQGQLQDAGNTTTLAHYLTLLEHAGLLGGIAKYAGEAVRQRGSSHKLQVFNTAFLSALSDLRLDQACRDPERWGRLVESAVGAHLLNEIQGSRVELFYWRHRDQEVDFVLKRGDALAAIEVKSTARRAHPPGLSDFQHSYPRARPLLVGGQGIALETFLSSPVETWLDF